MAVFSFSVLLYTVPIYILYTWVTAYFNYRRLRRFAERNGAEFPKHVRGKLPMGIGFVWELLATVHKGGDILDDVIVMNFERYGHTYSTPGFFGPPEIQTVDAQNIQAILANKFPDFQLGERRINQFRAFLGKSIFTSDGAYWEHSRALFRPQFARNQINDLEKTEEGVQALLTALPLVGDGKNGAITVDLMPMLFRFTLDTATGFLFGESVESQMAVALGSTAKTSAATAMAADQSGADMSFSDAFYEAQFWITTRVRLQGLYWLAPSKKGKSASDFVRRYVDHYVDRALRSTKPAGKKYSLLEALVESTKDKDELRDQILGILLAGRDTTATLLSWVCLLLAQHPAVFQKLRVSILEDFGPYTENPTNIDFMTLKGSRYLQYVMRETLRIYNAVPLNNRVAVQDTTLPRGGGPNGQNPIVVAKGQTVNFSPYMLHRRTDIWPDAFEFKPDRWDGIKLDWNYIPFSGGPRVCIGQQFALTEAGYLIVRLLQRFKTMEWMGPQGKPRKGLHFTMAPRDGVPVRLEYAD